MKKKISLLKFENSKSVYIFITTFFVDDDNNHCRYSCSLTTKVDNPYNGCNFMLIIFMLIIFITTVRIKVN
jgi:hypothetical protein